MTCHFRLGARTESPLSRPARTLEIPLLRMRNAISCDDMVLLQLTPPLRLLLTLRSVYLYDDMR